MSSNQRRTRPLALRRSGQAAGAAYGNTAATVCFFGTGKTTTLEAIRYGAEQNGYAVEGFAPTSRAARQLREAGVTADTVQGFLACGGQQRAAGSGIESTRFSSTP